MLEAEDRNRSVDAIKLKEFRILRKELGVASEK
jgi:hypothetical protein